MTDDKLGVAGEYYSNESKLPSGTALLVLGMHRSGTSAVTRCLSLLGASLPQHLMLAQEFDNDAGYWESSRIVAFNDSLLEQLGLTWDSIDGIHEEAFVRKSVIDRQAEALDLLRSEFPDRTRIVLKDPRISRLLPFWLPVLANAGFTPHAVLCVRNPLEVIDSLERRYGFSVSQWSQMLWLRHTLEAELQSRGLPRAVVWYDRLLDDPVTTLARCGRAIGLDLTADPQAREAVERFIRPQMRHNRYSDAEIQVRSDILPWVRRAWQALRSGDAATPDVEALDALGRDIAAADLLVRIEGQNVPDKARAESKLDRLDRLLGDLTRQFQAQTADAAAQAATIRSEIGAAVATVRGEFGEALDETRQAQDAAQVKTQEIQAALDKEQMALDAMWHQMLMFQAELKETRLDIDVVAKALPPPPPPGTARLSARATFRQLRTLYPAGAFGRSGFNILKQARLLARRPLLFNYDWYTRQVPEIQHHGWDPIVHFLMVGVFRGIDPNPLFSVAHYFPFSASTAGTGLNPLVHYILVGGRGGRDPHPYFDTAYYCRLFKRMPRGMTPLEHYLLGLKGRGHDTGLFGWRTLRLAGKRLSPCPLLDEDTYKQNMPGFDHEAALHHFARSGDQQGRPLSPLLSVEYIVGQITDEEQVEEAKKNTIGYYISHERFANVLPCPLFDPAYYRLTNPQLAGQPDPERSLLWHYRVHGEPNSHNPHPLFNVHHYRSSYPDMARQRDLLAHWLQSGRHEDRWASPMFDRLFFPRVNAAYWAMVEHLNRHALFRADVDSVTEEGVAAYRTRLLALLEGRPPIEDAPQVSIVVPVYRKVRHTMSCVESVLTWPSRYTYEIIIVDDTPGDAATCAAFADLDDRIVYRPNDRNLGFVRSCNAGAADARGAFVVMLNNDTYVLPGWLDELIGTLEADPRVGLAGSRLLYPEGVQQEAGGLIWQDGSAWNYGHRDDPRKPEYCYARSVDYISGASIALRKSVWDAFNGFDEAYVPAYCEDSDLALRVRDAGMDVRYQPLSMLIHFEGVSNGRDTSAGVKAYQIVNMRTQYERWRDRLAHHRPNGVEPDIERDRGVTRRVLVIDHRMPQPDHDAGSVTCVLLMRGLQDLGYHVAFADDNLNYMDKYTPDLQRQGIEVFYRPYYASIEDMLRRCGSKFDAIIVYRVSVYARHQQAIQALAPQAKQIFHTADLHFLREERAARLKQDEAAIAEAAQTKEREVGLMRHANAVIVHSTHEVEVLREIDPGIATFHFPLSCDEMTHGKPFSERKDIVFIGGYEHTPNVDAVDWFIAEIWPRIHAALPEARFKLVGSKAPEHLRTITVPGVEYVGFVEDLDTLFPNVRLSVVPLRFGAGSKGKLVTALSYGVPSVSTPIGSEGMGLRDGGEVMVAETAEAFAEKVIALYTDEALWQDVAAAGLAYLRDTASHDAHVARIRDLLQAIGVPLPAASG